MTPCFFSFPNFDANLYILQVSIFRRALPVRGELADGLTPAFFLQTVNQLKKGHGFSRFQRQGGMPSAMLAFPKGKTFCTAATFSLPIVFVWYPHTRSTLRDNRVQRERRGSYTIVTLRTAKKGLSARVSDNQSLHVSCHSYYCKEKKAHSLYNYQYIYIYIYLLSLY